MTEPSDSAPRDVRPQRPRGLLPPALADVLVPALKVGGMSGGAGAISGLAAGIIKDMPPVVFAVASGVQWFTLGSSFWLTRSVVVRAWGGEHTLTPRDRIKASAIGGTLAGTVGGLLRGPRNIFPGAVVFTIFGAAGQGFANKAQQWKAAEGEGSGWFTSKWSPLRKLSDEEYERFMSEKMLKVEAEIALIDDKVAELRMEEKAKRLAAGQPKAAEPVHDVQKGAEEQAAPQETEKPRRTGWWR